MPIDHEAPLRALAERLQTYCGSYLGRPVTRRLITWDQLGAAEKAAICVVGLVHSPKVGGPEGALWTITAGIYVYARADADPGSSAEPILNELVGKIEAALERQPNEATLGPGQMVQKWSTLGGAVQWAQPSLVEIDDGSQGNEGIALVTVDMLVQASP